MEKLEYKCGCGHRFPKELGKYGCPNCCGDFTGKLVAKKKPTSPTGSRMQD